MLCVWEELILASVFMRVGGVSFIQCVMSVGGVSFVQCVMSVGGVSFVQCVMSGRS